MPEAKVERSGNDIVIDWSGKTVVTTKPRVEKPVSVTVIDFDAKDGASMFTVDFDGHFDLIDAEMTDGTIRFGAKDTIIPRSLRRVVDALFSQALFCRLPRIPQLLMELVMSCSWLK